MKVARILVPLLIGAMIFSAWYAGPAGGDIPDPLTESPTPTPISSSGGSGAGSSPGESTVLPAGWYSCGLKGATLSRTGDRQTIELDIQEAGGAIDLYDHRIVFKNKGLQVSIETEEVLHPLQNRVSGTVKSATITSDPIFGEIKEIGGKFLVRFETTHPQAPPSGARIQVTLAGAPEGDLLQQFQDGAEQQGYEIRRLAYTMQVRTLDLSPSYPARITMSISPEWVAPNGGRTAVRIMRVAEDGMSEVLETMAAGYDPFGNYLFSADSPQGFSTFGLLSAFQVSPTSLGSTASPVLASPVEPPPASVPPPPVNPPEEATSSLPWFYLPAMVILLLVAGVGYLSCIHQMMREG